MKKLIISVCLGSLLLLTGCSAATKPTVESTSVSSTEKQEEYASAMKKGKEAIVDKDLSKAIAAFQLALEYKKGDKEAAALLSEATLYREAVSLKEEKNFSKALDKLSDLAKSKKISKALQQYGQELEKAILEEQKKGEASEEAKESEKPKAAEAQPVTLWNTQKKQQLNAFMSSWSTTMGQQYTEYFPGNDANLYGVYFPSTFASNNIAINGSKASVQWSDDGATADIYNVVAVYADTATADYMEKHVYLFTILNGQPLTLITMQNQGNPENLVYFSETENADLRNGFAQIVAK